MSQHLQELIDPVVADLGYELWHLEHVGPSADRILRIYIDAPAGVALEDCEAVSNEVSAMLDVAEAQGDRAARYGRLEVSSPGLDRPLVTAAHFARFVGETASVKLYAPIDGQRRLRGVIRAVADDTITLEMEDATHQVALSNVARARLDPAFEA